MILLLLACTADPPPRDSVRVGPSETDNFGDASSVRMVSPESGQSVTSPFELVWEAGADVVSVDLVVEGKPVLRDLPPAGTTSVELDAGRVLLELVAYDQAGTERSRDARRVRVVTADQEWVSFVTPADGDSLPNPVTFVLEGSASVDTIELSVEGWVLGTVAPGDVFTYRFNGTDQWRTVDAVATDASGATVATDQVEIYPASDSVAGASTFSEALAAMVDRYPTDGTYTYYWPQSGGWSGSTRDLYYQDQKVADDGGYSSCFCSGITWEWYLRTWQEYADANGLDREDLNGVSSDDIWTMRRDWYVRELDGDGPGLGLANHGLGGRVTDWDQVVRGDIVQLWRTSGSGHTAIFWDWELDSAGNREGFEYVSCQGAGLGHKSEYFGSHSGAVDPALVYFARAQFPEGWQ